MKRVTSAHNENRLIRLIKKLLGLPVAGSSACCGTSAAQGSGGGAVSQSPDSRCVR